MNFYKVFFFVLFVLFFNSMLAQTFIKQDSISIVKLSNPKAVWADFNSDFFYDLLIYGNSPVSDSTLFLLFENKEGKEFVGRKLPIFNLSVKSIQILDLDKDGLADLVFSAIQNGIDSLLSILFNKDKLNFELALQPLDSILTSKFLFKDFNQDNRNELIYISDLGELKFSLGTPNGLLRDDSVFGNLLIKHFYDLDIDSDGLVDLLVSNSNGADSLSRILKNQGGLNFENANLSFDSLAIQQISHGSFTKDDVPDFFIRTRNNQGKEFNAIVINKEKDQKDFIEVLPNLKIKDGFLADFDSDGTTDLWVNGADGLNSNYYWLKDINNVQDTILLASDSTIVTRFADFNFDGNLDFVEVRLNGDSLQIAFLKNDLIEENKAPSAPAEFSAVQDKANQVFIEWRDGFDSLTVKEALSYDLMILDAEDTSLINNSNVNLDNFSPTLPFHGKQLYANNQSFNSLAVGDYFYFIDAADNAFNYFENSDGGNWPRFAICELTDIQNSSIEICENSIYIAGDKGVERNWYSEKYGPIGTSDTFVYLATVDDTLYGTVTTFRNCSFGQLIIDVKVIAGEVPEVTLPEYSLVCPDDSVSFSVSADWINVQWSSLLLGDLGDRKSISFVPIGKDRITLLAENNQGCLYQFFGEVEVEDFKPEVADTLYQIKVGESVQLLAKGGSQYLWEPSNGLNNPRVADPIASPSSDITYGVTITSENGCAEVFEVVVQVEQIGNVANLFSPNGDGINDRILVFLSEIPKEFRFSIYNRSGNLIYDTKDPVEASQSGWDGTSNGADNPTGVYFWSVSGSFQNGQKLLLNGDEKGKISLVR
uniref:T9SS type B sorting domain-containing protein n=2 Tax=Roseivirga sp. TaxID=1964215 RepID=UPI0040483424